MPTIRDATAADIKAAFSTSTQTCPRCHTGFMPSRRWQIYCSSACRLAAYRQREIEHHTQVLTDLTNRIEQLERENAELRQRLGDPA